MSDDMVMPGGPGKDVAVPARKDTETPMQARCTSGSYTFVYTPNGWTLPHRTVDGVKEFHLDAGEIEHEFAPGTRARCWGYNGSTPGPTIEAVEGDRVRIYVTNRLPEHTSVHWHGVLLPSGMDGVGGLSQSHIKPGETFAYEFTLRQHGTHRYHPHADEMVQLAVGMMGMFIIHPKAGEPEPIDRDHVVMLHNRALHPGTYRPDPSVMQNFDLWTFNSKVFPAIEPFVARTGEQVHIRFGNLSMWNHPIHMHGPRFQVTGGDGGRWPRSQWRSEVTERVGAGQTRDLEFVAVPGDGALHCHMSHHPMNAIGHDVPNVLGVDQSDVRAAIRRWLPGYMAMGEHGMAEHQHVHVGQGPRRAAAGALCRSGLVYQPARHGCAEGQRGSRVRCVCTSWRAAHQQRSGGGVESGRSAGPFANAHGMSSRSICGPCLRGSRDVSRRDARARPQPQEVLAVETGLDRFVAVGQVLVELADRIASTFYVWIVAREQI